jgi:glycosyltransferase involved in cell wall biosynthesis
MPRLLFFMTPGNGFAAWRRVGSIERELLPYHEYLQRGWKVTMGTFDAPGNSFVENRGFDLAYCPHPRLLFTLPWYLKNAMQTADVIKTNQSAGAWWYVLAAKLLHKPILLRCGYVVGELLETTEGRTWRARHYELWEGWAFRHATFCQVPTEALRQWVCARYQIDARQVGVVPNFVDTRIFAPLEKTDKLPRSVVYVGNITPVKNLSLLVQACARAGASQLTLIGDGPEAHQIARLGEQLKVRVLMKGRVPNNLLPGILQQHEVYAQTSVREGHPKAFLEAMACGMPCVGTRVPGIREAVDHGTTGLLADPEVDAVAESLESLFSDSALRHRLGASAALSVHERFSFEVVFNKEYANVNRILERWRSTR